MQRLSAWVLVSLLIEAPAARAEDLPGRTHSSTRARIPPRIDGDLSDQAWRLVAPAAGMTQIFPDPGKPASFPTDIRVLHDDEALYIGVLCHDPEPEKIAARVTRRDRWIESDWFQVSIDSRHDHHTGFFFAVNPAGVKLDGTFFDENQTSFDWDGLWEAAARVVPEGWQLEMRIPLHLLRYQAGPAVRFGINFHRRVSRLNESDQWQYIPPEAGKYVSRFGELEGLDLLDRPQHLELTPYLAARPDISVGSDRGGVRPFDVGVDGRLSLGSNFMLTLTGNPDFGQVEVDQVVLNLSTIETYYPEKRPFFLEDMSLFQTPNQTQGPTIAQLFYTRRIGRAPRVPEEEEREEVVRLPMLPRIYGAAKLAGQTRGRFSFGLLQAVTSREDAWFREAGGVEFPRLAEPLTSFSILRLKQGFRDHSTVGLMATSTVTPKDGAALTGGADLQLELFDGHYQLGLLAFGSYLTQERFAWQDDFTRAALERQGPLGYGGQLSFSKVHGEHLVGSIYAFYYRPNLALNDVGYLDRADRAFVSARLKHHRLKPLGPVARYELALTGWVDRDTQGVNLGDGFNLDGYLEFKNGWIGGAWFFCGWPLCDDRETRSEGKVPFCGAAQRLRAGLWASSDQRKPMIAGVDLHVETTEQGQELEVWLPIQLNPQSRLQLELVPGYEISTGSIRWIDTEELLPGNRYLFAEEKVENWNLTLRGTYTFTTTLTLQAYAQLFLAAVDHRKKYAPTTPGTSSIHVGDLAEAFDVADDYDFTASNLNLSVVLRWEYLPGSVVYLVYSGAFGESKEIAEFRFGEVFSDLLRSQAQHVLLFKISYLWG